MADDSEGAIRMGSEDNPVVLDHFQTIVEVGWPQAFDYAVVSFGASYEWYDGTETFEDPALPGAVISPKWYDSDTFMPPPLFVPLSTAGVQWFDYASMATVLPPGVNSSPPEYAGKWGADYLTQIKEHISFGTSCKLRKKTYRKDEFGDLKPVVKWVSGGTVTPEIKPEKWGFPKDMTFAPLQFYPPNKATEEDEKTLDMYISDITGDPVEDRDQEIVYVEGETPTFADEGIPYVKVDSIEIYLWGYTYSSAPQKTRQLPDGYKWVNSPEVNANPDLAANSPNFDSPAWADYMAAMIGGRIPFGHGSITLYGMEISVETVSRNTAGEGEPPIERPPMKFRQVGAAMDEDENITILFERIRE